MYRSLFIPVLMVLALTFGCAAPLIKDGKKNDAVILSRSLDVSKAIENPYYKSSAQEDIAIVYAQIGMYEEAAEVAARIEDPLIQAYAFSHTAEIAWNNLRRETALLLLSGVDDPIQRIDDPQKKTYLMTLLSETYAGINETEKASNSLEEAYQFANQVEDDGMRAYDLTVIGNHFFKLGKKAKAGEILSEAYSVAKNIDDAEKQITIMDMIASILAEDDQYDKAFEIVKEIEVNITKAAGPDRITELYTSMGNFEKAVEIGNLIENPHTRTYTLARISLAAWNQGKNDLARRILASSAEVARSIEDASVKTSALDRVAWGYADAAQEETAVELAESIDDKYFKDDALEKISVRYAETGDFEKSIEVIGTVQDNYYKTAAATRVADAYLTAGKQEQAQQLLDQAYELSKEIPVEYQRFRAMAAIAPIYEKLGKHEKAIAVARAIEDDHFRNRALFRIASWYADTREFEKALIWAETIEDPYYQASAYTLIAEK
ncbi:MAG: hypothetical protein JRI83_06950 [Deltaproteobacteria bacterium]|nr:hypothetical protein [Deltaproteobacteria bacterium]